MQALRFEELKHPEHSNREPRRYEYDAPYPILDAGRLERAGALRPIAMKKLFHLPLGMDGPAVVRPSISLAHYFSNIRRRVGRRLKYGPIIWMHPSPILGTLSKYGRRDLILRGSPSRSRPLCFKSLLCASSPHLVYYPLATWD